MQHLELTGEEAAAVAAQSGADTRRVVGPVPQGERANRRECHETSHARALWSGKERAVLPKLADPDDKLVDLRFHVEADRAW